MNPIVPLILHATKNTAKLREFVIPGNTMVLINAYSVNNDENYFKDPFTWNPYRWIKDGKFQGKYQFSIFTYNIRVTIIL